MIWVPMEMANDKKRVKTMAKTIRMAPAATLREPSSRAPRQMAHPGRIMMMAAWNEGRTKVRMMRLATKVFAY